MLENSESLDWISELGTSEECNEDIIENCMRFVKEIIYSGSWKETYVETRGCLYKRQAHKSSLTPPPDPKSCRKLIKRAHHQSYIWSLFLTPIINPPPTEKCGWIYDVENEIVKPFWYDGSQFQ